MAKTTALPNENCEKLRRGCNLAPSVIQSDGERVDFYEGGKVKGSRREEGFGREGEGGEQSFLPPPTTSLPAELDSVFRSSSRCGIVCKFRWISPPVSPLLLTRPGFRKESFVFPFLQASSSGQWIGSTIRRRKIMLSNSLDPLIDFTLALLRLLSIPNFCD